MDALAAAVTVARELALTVEQPRVLRDAWGLLVHGWTPPIGARIAWLERAVATRG
jgi:hypothetical protein